MVAAVLHLDVGAGAPLDTLDQVSRRFPHRHDVVDGDLLVGTCSEIADACENILRLRPRVDARFGVVADDAIDFLHGGKPVWAGLRGAPGDDDPRLRAFASRSEERRVGKECRSRWSPY